MLPASSNGSAFGAQTRITAFARSSTADLIAVATAPVSGEDAVSDGYGCLWVGRETSTGDGDVNYAWSCLGGGAAPAANDGGSIQRLLFVPRLSVSDDVASDTAPSLVSARKLSRARRKDVPARAGSDESKTRGLRMGKPMPTFLASKKEAPSVLVVVRGLHEDVVSGGEGSSGYVVSAWDPLSGDQVRCCACQAPARTALPAQSSVAR